MFSLANIKKKKKDKNLKPGATSPLPRILY